ncbi:MAG: sugar phosphate isomerase/epimerase [Acidobacteria bacterium]|nr:sugar phosphate isomerase/epimerase [Acidobacteriota bacterium]
MKLGVFTLLFGAKPLEETLDYLVSLGVQTVEFGAGGYVASAHFPVARLLEDGAALGRLKNAVQQRKLEVSALSCHGNPLHPNPDIARAHHQDFVSACQLAARLDAGVVNTLSGCPGSDPAARFPNWITCPIPPEDFLRPLEWQWSERVIPYWKEAARIAAASGVRVGIEMVPNNVVYNLETLFQLRNATSETIGANLDPSHLFWQGADILTVIGRLGPAIHHFHAKDSGINEEVVRANGIIDPKSLTDEPRRSWIFRTIGHGHDQLLWNRIVAHLRMAGYDGALSIEHEDSLMSADEGLRKAIAFLQQALIREKPGLAYWAQ